MRRTCLSLAIGAIFVFFAMSCHGRGSASAHATDFKEVFNGYSDLDLWLFYAKFSSDIDDNKNAEVSSSVSARIKRKLAEKKGVTVRDIPFTMHRYIAHQWVYGGSIPPADLMILENRYPGCTDDIRRIWSQFCKENNDIIAQEFRLPQRLAEAYCAILYYTHLLGDWLPAPENSDWEYLMPVEKIVLELQNAVGKLGHGDKHKEYCDRFQVTLKTALAKGLAPQSKAELVLQALKSMKLGTMLHESGQMDESKHSYKEEAAQTELKKAA